MIAKKHVKSFEGTVTRHLSYVKLYICEWGEIFLTKQSTAYSIKKYEWIRSWKEREEKNPLCVLHEDKLSPRKNKAAQKKRIIQYKFD